MTARRVVFVSASPEEISAEIFASFTLQDSGCHAFGVAVDDCRLFIKASAEDRAIASPSARCVYIAR